MSTDTTVAKAVRMEHNPETDTLYIVFEIVDEDFKKRIKDDWMQDVELKLLGKGLVEKE
jgi:hypothetical protein